jgi:hypothetical protein
MLLANQMRSWSSRPYLWLGLFYYAYSPLALILFLFKQKADIYTPKMGWSAALPLPEACPCCVTNLLSLPFTTTHLFIWHVGVSGQIDIWNPWSLGLGPKTLSFNRKPKIFLPQNMTIGDQGESPQNMPLWRKDYFELNILRDSCENKEFTP